jgi:type IV secretory pathway VirB2 component (pilin)
MTMRPRPLPGNTAWNGPWLAEYRQSPTSPLGHGLAVVAVAGAAYLAQTGQVLVAVGIAVVLAVMVFLKSTPPG